MVLGDLQVHLSFLSWQDLYATEKPFQIFIDIPTGAEDQRDTNLVFKKALVEVRDIRHLSIDLSLDANGFIYRKHTTKTEDFTQKGMVEQSYLPEIEELLKAEMEDVDRVFFFDWRVSSTWPRDWLK